MLLVFRGFSFCMRPLSRLVAFAVALWMSACGGSPATPAPAAGGTFTSAHFTFNYTALDSANIGEIAAAVEREHARILTDLGLDSVPAVMVTFYSDHAAMEAATRATAGVIPAWASGLVTSSTQIHLMSPNSPAWAPYSRMLSNLVHEFAHCVSMRLNPAIANNPRWLWEAVAIYEAGQAVDLRTIGYMAALQPPPFAALDSVENGRVYDVGYSIAEFVVARWGRRGLTDLVSASGNTSTALGIPLTEFERDWFAFARQRYGF